MITLIFNYNLFLIGKSVIIEISPNRLTRYFLEYSANFTFDHISI